MDSLDLFSSHEFDSFWRFQGLDGLVPGKLYLSPQEIKLVLSGPRENVEPLRGYISERDGPLTGHALDGSELSLVGAFASGGSFYRGPESGVPRFSSVNVFANICVAGRRLAAEGDRVPGELWLSFPLLIEWFRHNPYRSPTPAEPDILERLEVRDVGTLLDVELPRLRSRLRSFHSISMTMAYFDGYRSSVEAFLCFEPGACNTAHRAVERAFSCTALWTVLCGAHVAPSRIFFQELVEEGDRPRVGRIHIFVPLGELVPPDRLHPGDVLLPFETIGDTIGPVADAWLSDEGPPRDAVNLFLRAFRQHRRGHFDREVFQNLVTALEALADAEGIGAPLMDRAAAKELRSRLESVLDELVQGDIKEPLRRRIADINKGTLKQKLSGFSGVLPPDAAARFAVLREPFLQKVVNTRNYHAHRSGRSGPAHVLHDEELFQATDQLQLLVLLLLLRAAGVPADMVMARMLKRWDFRQILERGLKGA